MDIQGMRSCRCPGCSGYWIPELSSSEDESPPRMPRRPPWKMPTKHSTPEGQEPALHWSPRPRGQASYLRESPVPAHSTQDLGSHLAGLSPGATFKRRRLSTIYALEERPSMQAGSCSDPSALRDDSPVPASLARSQQKAKNLQAKSWPRSTGLPGIPDTTRRKRRDPKGQAAVMLRVREWEARLLRDIEAAVQHELTIQAEGEPSMGMIQVSVQEPATSD
ncbi:coiled-coil domain-containing protein 201 isoform X3 [Cavia porcellus]|uniref:coiled-coil domain-containing protein 201 isoform X3 n=1 Tax=Cavia porcellus TaxID=10141 RepID=UPI002FE08D1A